LSLIEALTLQTIKAVDVRPNFGSKSRPHRFELVCLIL
jgi:hypothetical protein